MRRFFVTALLGASLATPALMRADDHDRDRDHNRVERYYDHGAKDWHEWNEAQQRAYHRWWDEHRRDKEFREFNRLNEREQRDYWHWWHEHEEHERH